MEKLNITELLKDCPRGMELDCPLYDNVTFERVADNGIWIKHIDSKSNEHSLYVYNDGSFPIHNLASLRTKCIIFPKGKTTWDGFQRPFKDGDIVTWDDRGSLVACIFKERKNTASFNHHIALYKGGLGIAVNGEIALPDNELSFATEEEKQLLFDAIEANGYKWNPETKTLKKLIKPKFKVGDYVRKKGGVCDPILILEVKDDSYFFNAGYLVGFLGIKEQDDWELVPKKFDITTLKPFDKVLVRCNELEIWHISFFEKYNRELTKYPFICLNKNKYSQCIPYQNNEHLLDTADNCDDFYKTW